MTSSDANAISAVVVRDILPALRRDHLRMSSSRNYSPVASVPLSCLPLSMVHRLLCGSLRRCARTDYSLVCRTLRAGHYSYNARHTASVPRCGPAAALISWSGGVFTLFLSNLFFRRRLPTSPATWPRPLVSVAPSSLHSSSTLWSDSSRAKPGGSLRFAAQHQSGFHRGGTSCKRH